ncbi:MULTISPECIES: hypothetical protein [unclassified Streptomyces]|uniref:hypothetical protein n=1 Tax=unclassified Streptomyces TaxID=2593676 RepID=UPI002E175168|nr:MULTISPECIES: hypothetical protein [unclassified Streptomyces]
MPRSPRRAGRPAAGTHRWLGRHPDQAIRSAAEAQILRTDVEGVLLDPRERSVIDVDTHLK